MYYATKRFTFEMAHILTNYDGPCGNVHGHSYKCLVTFSSNELNNDNMVLDFNKVKKICNELIFDKLDHSFAVNINSTDACEIDIWHVLKAYKKKISEFNNRTTAEYMSKWIYETINKYLSDKGFKIKCSKIELWETESGHATYKEER